MKAWRVTTSASRATCSASTTSTLRRRRSRGDGHEPRRMGSVAARRRTVSRLGHHGGIGAGLALPDVTMARVPIRCPSPGPMCRAGGGRHRGSSQRGAPGAGGQTGRGRHYSTLGQSGPGGCGDLTLYEVPAQLSDEEAAGFLIPAHTPTTWCIAGPHPSRRDRAGAGSGRGLGSPSCSCVSPRGDRPGGGRGTRKGGVHRGAGAVPIDHQAGDFATAALEATAVVAST